MTRGAARPARVQASLQADATVNEAAALQRQVGALQQRVAQLEQSQAELEAFASAVAHDLRTPLSAMEGFCSLLESTLAELPQDEARSCEHYALRLRAGLVHMDELVTALLRLSRVATAPLQCECVDLSALAQEVLDGLVARQPQRAHRLQVQPGLQAWGDRALLRQLLANLLGNAWKFSAAQSEVRIEVGREAPGGAFFVRDHGAGFDMGQAQRLFQPFERLHSAVQFEGTGVGLATVRRIVRRHGGQVHAHSAPGAGATFFFTLGEPAHPTP